MQFKAFSSRIESRVLGIVTLLSVLPIAVLTFGSWQQMQRLTINHFEDRLQSQLQTYTSDLAQRLNALSSSIEHTDDPHAVEHLMLIRETSTVAPPKVNRQARDSRPHLIHSAGTLWISVEGDTKSDLLEINQQELLSPLRKLFPSVGFCFSLAQTGGPVCGFVNAEDLAININSPIKLDDGCLLYTSPSPRDLSTSRMPSSA